MNFILVFIAGVLFYVLMRKEQYIKLSLPILLFSILVMLDFFGAFTKGGKAILFFTLPFVFFGYRQPSLFKKYIIVFVGGLFLSMISCYYFRKQTFLESFWVYNSLYGLLFFFFIRSFSLSVKRMERILVVLFILILVSYIIQYLVYPKLIFIGEDQEYEEDIRIRLVGQGLVSLGYFFSLNKLLIKRKKVVLYGGILICSLLVIFLMGFRTMILGVVVVTAIMCIKVIGFNYKLLGLSIFLLLISVFVINIPVVSEKLDSMSERQKTDNLGNSEYIRLAQFAYYTQEHFTNLGEYLMGSGLPQRGNPEQRINATYYGKYMDSLVGMGLNWVDWGLLSMSWMIGIIPVLVIIVYSIKAFLIKVDKNYYYLGLWFLYLLMISFTTMEIVRSGNLAVQAFCFVLIERLLKLQKSRGLKEQLRKQVTNGN